ncbi:MAG: hypothetical protein PVJ52_03370 [Candidatus Woesebacteria bacterium]
MIYLILLIFQIIVLFLLSRRVQQLIFRYLLRFTKDADRAIFFFSHIFSIGTLIHELAHMLTAFVLFVPVGEIDLTPRIEKERLVLGRVHVGNTDGLRKIIIGIAPLLFGLAVIILSIYFFLKLHLMNQWWALPALTYLVFGVGNTMFLSKKDLEGFRVLLVILLVSTLLLRVLVVAGFVSFPQEFTPSVVDFLIQTNIFLLVPVAIDVLVILLLK